MAYNEKLAERVEKVISKDTECRTKKMFGGVCFLLNGNMACGILNNDLIVRVGPDNYEKELVHPDAGEFDITGRPMKGWVMVSFAKDKTDKELKSWVRKGAAFALSLPPK